MVDKDTFRRYLKAQREGKYNMLTQWVEVANEYRIPNNAYIEIIHNYDKLYNKYCNPSK